MADTYEKVKAVVAERLLIEEDKISPDARFREDLEVDSLGLVDLIMRLEEEFGIEISEEDAEGLATVQDAVTYIDQHSNG